MKLKLTIEEASEAEAHSKEGSLFHRRRFIKATVLLMLHYGFTIGQIEMSLGIDDNTIFRYAKAYREKGLKKYMEDGYVPYSGKRVKKQRRLLPHIFQIPPCILHFLKNFKEHKEDARRLLILNFRTVGNATVY